MNLLALENHEELKKVNVEDDFISYTYKSKSSKVEKVGGDEAIPQDSPQEIAPVQ